jgi:hypothetical protein
MHNWKRLNVTDYDEEEATSGRYVLYEDAVAREAELLARIQVLEERTARAAELMSKALGLMSPTAQP